MKKSVIYALIVIILVLLYGIKTWHDAGEFKEILSRNDMRDCREYGGVANSEDIAVHPVLGMAFISSDDIRLSQTRDDAPQGMIYGLDLDAEDGRLIELTPDLVFDFHPLGLGLYTPDDTTTFLFVVNRSLKAGHSVEIFRYAPDSLLRHVETIRDPLIRSANDVAPVGRRSFYVTNDHRFTGGLMKSVEDYLQLSLSNVIYYDGSSARVIAGGLGYANSVLVDEAGGLVFVSATIDQGIHVYEREPSDGSLVAVDFIELGTGVDNLTFDADGAIWAAAHPQLLTFVAYLKGKRSRSPSQILKIRYEKDTARVEEIFLSQGEDISASSVAARYRDHLLIGSVLDHRLLDCLLRSQQEGMNPQF